MNWHPDFRIDGISPEKWIENSGVEYAEVAKGISEWNSEKTEFTFMTSGSTGVPKAISISRDVMIHSAKSTGKYFNLENGSTAFLCLPVEFIGGFMMLVRSMVIGLNITVSHPQVKNIIKSDSEFDFVAMTPFQVSKILEASPDFFNGIKYLIIGGGLVPAELRNKLYLLNTNCYSTYGMTETCSHIALNRIEPNNARFIGFLDVNFTTNLQDQLVISAPNFGVRELVTNDLVVLNNAHSFEWVGRLDNVINTGGIKVNPEKVERFLDSQIESNFFVSGIQHPELGNEVVLFIEGEKANLKLNYSELSQYEIPKRMVFIDSFSYTKTNKINRTETLRLLNVL